MDDLHYSNGADCEVRKRVKVLVLMITIGGIGESKQTQCGSVEDRNDERKHKH